MYLCVLCGFIYVIEYCMIFDMKHLYVLIMERAACGGMVALDSTPTKQIPKHNNIHIPIEHYNTRQNQQPQGTKK